MRLTILRTRDYIWNGFMKKFNRYQLILGMLCLILASGPLLCASIAQAAPDKVSELKSKLRDEKALVRKIKTLAGRLSTAQLQRLAKSRLAGIDSDSDGIPDSLEGGVGSNVCDSDSDDDGIGDDDELENGSDPGDDDSDDDGHEDGTEINKTGLVESFSSSIVTVGGLSFTVSDSTLYRNGAVSDLVAGKCVEVEGHYQLDGGNQVIGRIADKVQFKNQDDC